MRVFIMALLASVLIHIIPCAAIGQTKSSALPGSHTDIRMKQGAYWIPTGNPWHGILPSDIAGHRNRVNEARGKQVYFVPNVAYNRWREQKLAERMRLRRLGLKVPVPQPGDIVMTYEEVQWSMTFWERRSGVSSDLMPHPLLIEGEKYYPWRKLLKGAGWQGVMPRVGQ
ncbi:hypothetical protein [Desulfoferula mesophila]|uniref:Uncharacterized protein n=1 Tax=Desulfoferula mesophila TaxID=3058419 RepID=A0AAU9ENT7_9BACT|nr:hypothetical protein FAK_32550 [Desulfoferula mesophilus]